jgi:hypothetical protein
VLRADAAVQRGLGGSCCCCSLLSAAQPRRPAPQVWRDEGYLHQMLRLLAALHGRCVLAGAAPAPDFYMEDARWAVRVGSRGE